MVTSYGSEKLSVKQLSSIQLFLGFDKEDFNALSDIIKIQEFERGSRIITEGDEAQKLYFILEGSAMVYKKNNLGKEELVGNLLNEHYFGEMAFVDHGTRSATVVADTNLVVAEFSWTDFCNKFVEKPFVITKIFKNLAHNLSLRLRRANAVYSYINPNDH